MTQVRNPDGTYGGSDKDADRAAMAKLRRHDIRKQDIDRIVQALDDQQQELVVNIAPVRVKSDVNANVEVFHNFEQPMEDTLLKVVIAVALFTGMIYLAVRI
jgi:hypothetical protein